MISRGSEWRRWDPHIHAPGTVLNDLFGSGDPWESYITALEGRAPVIEAIGLTDYYVTDCYDELCRRKSNGRLPNVKLIFPNIELRLDVAAKSGFVNLHLLVSPEDADHVEQVQRLLSRLQFPAHGDHFDCTRAELIRLGKKADPTITSDRAALKNGATQFKVNFRQLREVISGNDWAKTNILIAVAGGANDGTSGLRQAADETIRAEIEKFAHVIFSASPATREFWTGRRDKSRDELEQRYDGCKPCLHGSDAHDLAKIGQPDGDRYCWIKGSVTFDALRQAYIEPEGRAFVGTEPPKSAMPSQVISQLTISDASWAETPTIKLNPGLVAIIGARGSGKTALADVIAAGCDAIPDHAWQADENVSPSFLVRARKLIGSATATLTWGGGTANTCRLDGTGANGPFSFPRARYLSQQFVEELCSARGASEGLIREIERIIFEAHSPEERGGALSFEELRDHKILRFQQARQREAHAISAISERVGDEFEKEGLVTLLATQVAQKNSLIANYTADLSKLVLTGTEAQVKRHDELSRAAQSRQATINGYKNRRRTFEAMQDEVRNTRASKAPEMLRETQARHATSYLTPEQWADFLLIYKGNVDANLASYIAWVDVELSKLVGIPPIPGDATVPIIRDDADLTTLPLLTLNAEIVRLESFFSADKVVREQYAALSARIAQERLALQNLTERLADAQGASERRRQLQIERDAAYRTLFEAIVAEQSALESLYKPLMVRLAGTSGTLKKLSFSVKRAADASAWGNFAEDTLIDCRKAGAFNGRGSLIRQANDLLKPAWEAGSAADVQAAMANFLTRYWQELVGHAPVAPLQQSDFRAWAKRFAHWAYGTSHISVHYEMAYDGIDIRKLSPGTRGIVLLLLYLALDDGDDRPLIIDQPEENLDPKSVFDELVPLFIQAKTRRQVIIVTHNANLVVNTDADQIIVAEAGGHDSGGLPSIRYVSGGLEDAPIRKAVCDILEGGERAFRERARRLRVRLDR